MRCKSLVVACVAAGAMSAPAVGSTTDGLVRGPQGALIGDSGLAPGSSRTSSVTVSNPLPEPAEMRLAVSVSREDENGCLRPEVLVETERCDADGGELGDWLEVDVRRDGVPVWSGPLVELGTAPGLPGLLPPGRSWRLELTVGLPIEATNESMSDRIAFDVLVIATSASSQARGRASGSAWARTSDSGDSDDPELTIVRTTSTPAAATSYETDAASRGWTVSWLLVLGGSAWLSRRSVVRRPIARHRK